MWQCLTARHAAGNSPSLKQAPMEEQVPKEGVWIHLLSRKPSILARSELHKGNGLHSPKQLLWQAPLLSHLGWCIYSMNYLPKLSPVHLFCHLISRNEEDSVISHGDQWVHLLQNHSLVRVLPWAAGTQKSIFSSAWEDSNQYLEIRRHC